MKYGRLIHYQSRATFVNQHFYSLLYYMRWNKNMRCQKIKLKKNLFHPTKRICGSVQPPSGGIAPGMAPTDVFSQDFLLKVYKNKYKIIVRRDNMHVKKFTLK